MMRVIPIGEENIGAAARIHSASWRESHKQFCSEAFVAAHTPERQAQYLKGEIAKGARLYMLEDEEPAGIVSIRENMIENLYVHPKKQRRGYGTALLRFAVAQCDGEPRLWILSNNVAARALYERNGFELTGRRERLSNTLEELEMKKRSGDET